MQALAPTNGITPLSSSTSKAIKPAPQSMIILPENKNWTIAERIGGKISIDLANGSSCNNSGKGSRSSGMQVIFIIF